LKFSEAIQLFIFTQSNQIKNLAGCSSSDKGDGDGERPTS